MASTFGARAAAFWNHPAGPKVRAPIGSRVHLIDQSVFSFFLFFPVGSTATQTIHFWAPSWKVRSWRASVFS